MIRYQHVRRAGITQLVEYQLPKLKVAGSSPVARSIHPSPMSPTRRTLSPRIGLALWLAALLACAPTADVPPPSDFDRAVSRFVAGDYEAAIAEMEKLAASTTDEAVRRDAYTYLGRSHMALGRTDEAVEAFTLGVNSGDRGVCVAYLELLRQYVEGSPGTLHTRDVLTRAQLAGAIVRLMGGDGGDEPGPAGPTPLATAAARGWMPALPDGDERADLAVTRAALYVVVARLLAEGGVPGGPGAVWPGGYRQAMAATDPVSGTEAMAILERVKTMRENHGR